MVTLIFAVVGSIIFIFNLAFNVNFLWLFIFTLCWKLLCDLNLELVSSRSSIFTKIVSGNNHELDWLSWLNVLKKTWTISKRFMSSCIKVVLEWNPSGSQIISLHCNLDNTFFWSKCFKRGGNTGKFSC
jgi:hypothetical protein